MEHYRQFVYNQGVHRLDKPEKTSDPESFLPLKPDVFTILLVLLDGERHGYAIMKASAQRRGSRGALQPGALYRLLRQMLDSGLVTELDRRQVDDSADERRRYYAITEWGIEVAAAEAQRMSDLVEVSQRYDLLEEGKAR